VDEIIAIMRAVDNRADGQRLHALIVLLWRAGLRISEALALQESDFDRSRGALLVRRGEEVRRVRCPAHVGESWGNWLNQRLGEARTTTMRVE
jgi:integrase